MGHKSVTLGEGLPQEIERVREIIKIYQETAGQAGSLAISLMKRAILMAEEATANGDTVGMLNAYYELTSFEV